MSTDLGMQKLTPFRVRLHLCFPFCFYFYFWFFCLIVFLSPFIRSFSVVRSVTRFGDISPLWHNFNILWQFFMLFHIPTKTRRFCVRLASCKNTIKLFRAQMAQPYTKMSRFGRNVNEPFVDTLRLLILGKFCNWAIFLGCQCPKIVIFCKCYKTFSEKI